MFAAHVGIDVFLKGLSVYLKQHLYGSTTSQDLWRALSEVAGFDVGDMLKEWMGEVRRSYLLLILLLILTDWIPRHHCRRCRNRRPCTSDEILGARPSGCRTRQSHLVRVFFALNSWIYAQVHDRNVPLSTITKNNHGTSIIDRSHILSKREAMLDLDTSRPFKLNVGTTGVCELLLISPHRWAVVEIISDRVLYTGNLFDGVMREAVKVGSIFAAEDRVGLLLDTLAFAKAGLAKTSGVLALANALRHDRDCK
jgi:aminopeptidase 2